MASELKTCADCDGQGGTDGYDQSGEPTHYKVTCETCGGTGTRALTPTPAEDASVNEKKRYHIEGQTSTVGALWQIWDGERHFARFRNIADMGDAVALCDELNALTRRAADDEVTQAMIEVGVKSLRWTLGPPRSSDEERVKAVYLAMRRATPNAQEGEGA